MVVVVGRNAYFIDEKSGNMYYNRHHDVDVSESGVADGWPGVRG